MSEAAPLSEMFREWIDLINHDMGFELQVTPEGGLAFETVDGLAVTVEVPSEAPLMILHSPLMPIPPGGDAALFQHLLELNAYGVATRGGSIGLAWKAGDIVYAYSWQPERPQFVAFSAVLAGFIHTARELKAKVSAQLRMEAGDPMPPFDSMMLAFTTRV